MTGQCPRDGTVKIRVVSLVRESLCQVRGAIVTEQVVAISLTAEQEAAVDAAVRSLSGEGAENLTIGGFAGVGKTYIVKTILERMEKKGKYISVGAFAGKAASVLRRKGVHRAQTLHSLIYKPEKKDGQLVFTRVFALDCDGVIVDEASMINTTLYEDLLSFGIPVVFIGDHGQLEPIGDNPGVMANPHIKLEKIHRQAEDSAILWLAHLFRQGKKPNWATVPTSEIRRLDKREVGKVAHDYDVVLCGFNKSRVTLNRIVRDNRGIVSELAEGERLICLKNTQTGFFNGQMFYVEKIHEKKSVFTGSGFRDCFVLDIKTEDAIERKRVTVWLANGAQEDLRDFPRDIVVADFGYALTVHKAQGSSWGKVLVLEEVWAEKWDWRRWCYTAATRAEKELAWVPK